MHLPVIPFQVVLGLGTGQAKSAQIAWFYVLATSLLVGILARRSRPTASAG